MGSYTSSLSKEQLLENSPKIKFIQAVNNGQVEKAVIDKWLIEDFGFLLAYVHFTEHVHDIAPENTKQFWHEAIGAIEDEIVWFDKELKERGIRTDAIKQKAGSDEDHHWLYQYMETIKSYLAFATAVYAFELAAYEAWKQSKIVILEDLLIDGEQEVLKSFLTTLVHMLIKKLKSSRKLLKTRVVKFGPPSCKLKLSMTFTSNL